MSKVKLLRSVRTLVVVLLLLPNFTLSCILLLNGWMPLTIEERASLADVVLTGFARRTFKNTRTRAGTYTSEFQIFNVLKGENVIQTVSTSHAKVYNISNFGPKTMCYADITEGRSYILFLTTFGGRLSAKYDDIFGAATEWSPNTERVILEGLGWKEWSSWTACSKSCDGGTQLRQRECTRKDESCDGPFESERKCNTFACFGAVDLVSTLLAPLPRGVHESKEHSGAYSIDSTASLHIPTVSVLPRGLPSDFSVIFTIKPKEENYGYLLTITELSGTTRLGVQVGYQPMFEYADKNGYPGTKSPTFSVNLSDGNWHQVGFSVHGTSVTMYYDCQVVMKRRLKRNPTDSIGTTTVMSIGAKFGNVISDQNFEGDISQLVLVPDRKAAAEQCSHWTITDGTSKKPTVDRSNVIKPAAASDGIETPISHQVQSSEAGNAGEEEKIEETKVHRVEWSSWGPCSVSCGQGVQTRTAYCKDNDVSSQDCLDQSKPSIEKKACYREDCKKMVICRIRCRNGGRCIAGNKCVCQPGFSGHRCQKAMCNPPCQGGGRCVGKNTCSCPAGTQLPDCKPVCNGGCHNGGVCVSPEMCKCKDGYTGAKCELPVCKKGCFNGGRCVGPNHCSCRSGYIGDTCQTPVCFPDCQNGGSCIQPYVCSCPAGSYGRQCQKFSCTPSCRNSGRCVGPNTCSCHRGYTGRYCQTATCPRGCENGGQCIAPRTCQCPKGYHGRRCERKQCRYVQTTETYQRGYPMMFKQFYQTKCGPWGWKMCDKVKTVYRMVYRTFQRPVYKCV